MDNEDEMADELFRHYLKIGALRSFVDETGETVYGITEQTKELAPELYEEWVKDIDEALMDLFQKGLVDVSYDEELNAIFSLTEDGQVIFDREECADQ